MTDNQYLSPPSTPAQNNGGKRFIVLAIIFGILILAAVGIFAYNRLNGLSKKTFEAKKVEIPGDVLKNKFGFLSGGADDLETIKSFGAAWIRPHPGPFLWDAIQNKAGAEFNFQNTDSLVLRAGNANIGTLATIWPFADWDQKNYDDPNFCKVSANDEFLPQNDKKGRGDYLPQYRCVPHDWEKYQKFVTAMVERYDGDGTDDMANLKIPVKYWEVMNEPDLVAGGDPVKSLDFFKQGSQEYAELLQKTNEAIKQADLEAKVLIAGAAGGDDQFLQFYRQMFSQTDLGQSFDIGNIHCISSGSIDSFNLEPYKEMFEKFFADKSIWVTEAQAVISTDPDTNAAQVYKSTKNALILGAERIFFTQYDFEPMGQGVKPAKEGTNVMAEIDGDDPEEAYKIIIGQN